jgi:acyl-coenzyme A synthetase/AMP-(fatty) acid ligase
MELYGCTESGAIATRRTVQDEYWQTMDGVTVTCDNEGQAWVQGGHVGIPTALQDVIEPIPLSPSSLPHAGERDADSLREAHVIAGGTRFRLLSRKADLVNIAGKRASLGDLNRQLSQIPGVQDGVFFVPDDIPGAAPRLIALVVAPGLHEGEILAALRQKIDTAFLPRPVYKVDGLPRTPTGKLPRNTLIALLEEMQHG